GCAQGGRRRRAVRRADGRASQRLRAGPGGPPPPALPHPAALTMAGAAPRWSALPGLAARALLSATAPAPGRGVPVDPAGGVSVTYVGHATVLVRLGDATFLTDPIYAPRLTLLQRLLAPPAPPRRPPP